MWHVQSGSSSSDIHHSTDADPHQSHQQNEYGNGQWGDVVATARVGPSTTPRRCKSIRAMTSKHPPVIPIKVANIAPGPPPPVSATSISTTVTPVTTTGGSTPRRTLTDDDRRLMCEYHESHPGVKQTEIGGTSPALYLRSILQLTLSSNI